MKESEERRLFLKKLGLGGAGMSAMPSSWFTFDKDDAPQKTFEEPPRQQKIIDTDKPGRGYNGPYKNNYLNRVAFPIGGIGAGMFCLEGTGAISHMSVKNKPELFHEPGMFAAVAVKGLENGAKVLEGPVPAWKMFGQRGTGNGAAGSTYGLPRFSQAEFITKFPFGHINLEDNDLPLKVELTGWSPFIPTDADNSSLPVGALEYKFVNTGSKRVEAVFSYNSKNFIAQNDKQKRIKKIKNGFVLSREGTKEKPQDQEDFAVFTNNSHAAIDYCWFRGGWWDPLTMVWNTISDGQMKTNDPVASGAPGASLFVPFSLGPNEERVVRVMMAWYVPVTDLHVGEVGVAAKGCDPSSGCCSSSADLGMVVDDHPSTNYSTWYSNKFNDIIEVVDYWSKNYDELRKNSGLFSDAFYASTLPPEITEAVAANLTILKSPTVMRQHDGRLWNWEGCSDDRGCCHGSCTHVWNYAQAIPHLFPFLERSLRHTEFCENQNEAGHQKFRANLPISLAQHDFYSAADGQLGGIMKVYREWRISGDTQWVKKMYPMVKKGMDYCILTWDPKEKGVVEEPHHNTYDIEFWGPDGMCTSFYLGALQAISKMGKHLKKDVSSYKKLYSKGKRYLENNLFNGEYFIQDIQWTGLQAADPVKASEKSFSGEYSDEALKILQEEGPKYQYGKGCLSDGVLGAWIALMCGMEHPVDSEKIKSHLMSVYKYNLKQDLSDHPNPQRPAYALGNEGGLLLCTWPKGGKLSLPFVYSNEVWTGIEYQVASHLMALGKVKEGLEIVRTCRDRYDGEIRNPFNEYECGSWYARAMASYGLLQGITGVRYDAVDQHLFIDSKIGDFTSFISTGTGFGTVSLKNGQPVLKPVYGHIPVKKVIVSGKVLQLENKSG